MTSCHASGPDSAPISVSHQRGESQRSESWSYDELFISSQCFLWTLSRLVDYCALEVQVKVDTSYTQLCVSPETVLSRPGVPRVPVSLPPSRVSSCLALSSPQLRTGPSVAQWTRVSTRSDRVPPGVGTPPVRLGVQDLLGQVTGREDVLRKNLGKSSFIKKERDLIECDEWYVSTRR